MGWRELQAITQEFRQLARDEKDAPPLACWPCGTPLERAPDGGLFCPADGWRPDQMGELRS